MTNGTLTLEFCGESYEVGPQDEFTIGRESDLVIDDNPYLHRHFLKLYREFDLWWLGNVGSLLSATVTDSTGRVQAWLAPGAKLPVVFQDLTVMFTAGSTNYDFSIHSQDDYFNTRTAIASSGGATTIEPVTLTRSQRLLIVALAEHVLDHSNFGKSAIPTTAEAAQRLQWPVTTFNRKLDNVCEKLDKIGVPGLRGGKGKLATNRRSRLVEYAVASKLVSSEDLSLLDEPKSNSEKD